METAVNIWNLLWDYQIHIVVVVVFLIWLVVRGGDVIRWMGRKIRGKGGPTGKTQQIGSNEGGKEQ